MMKPALTKSFLAGMIALGTAAHAVAGPIVQKEVIIEEIEPEQWWSAEISFGAESKYMFRGFDQFFTGPAGIGGGPGTGFNVLPFPAAIVRNSSPLIYTDLSFSAYGLTAGMWYGDNTASTGFNELDAYVDYTYSWGPVDLSVGYIGYFFPDTVGAASLHEVYLGFAYTAIPYVTPSVTWYQGFGLSTYQGRYLEVKLEGDIPVYDGFVDVSLAPYALISYADYVVRGRSNWNHYQLGMYVNVGLNEYITVYGGVNYSGPLDLVTSTTGFAGAAGFHPNSDFWGGGGITFSF